MPRLPTPHSTASANASLAGVAGFFLVAAGLQGLRPDLDWWRAPLSFYLVGAYGAALQAAYVGLALSLALIGLQFRQALRPAARSDLAPWLFATAGFALAVTAFADTDLPGGAWTMAGVVHGVAAPTAFLCVTVAMLLQSWHLRGDPSWRRRFGIAFALALASFAGLWVHTLVREWPRGLTQRVVIVLILAWLALAAGWLRGAARAQSAAGAALPSSSR